MHVWIDWGKLVQQWRAKAVWISWNKEELNAVYVLGIPADYVRKGILTTEDYNRSAWTILEEDKDELLDKARDLWIPATDDANVEWLKQEISNVEDKESKEDTEEVSNEPETETIDEIKPLSKEEMIRQLREAWVMAMKNRKEETLMKKMKENNLS